MKFGRPLVLGSILAVSTPAFGDEVSAGPSFEFGVVDPVSLVDFDSVGLDEPLMETVLEDEADAEDVDLEIKQSGIAAKHVAGSLALLIGLVGFMSRKSEFWERFEGVAGLREKLIDLREALRLANEALEKRERELKQAIAAHQTELACLKELHGKERDAWVAERDRLSQSNQGELDTLRRRIDHLNAEISRLKERRMDDLKKAADGTVITEVLDSMGEVIRMAEACRDRMNIFARDENLKEGEFFLLFSYNPDLSRIMATLKVRMDYILEQFCGSQNPDAAANAAIVEPLVLQLDQLNAFVDAGMFKEALKGAYKLVGQVEMLLQIAGGEVDMDGDPNVAWYEYVNVKNISADWLDEVEHLIDFFQVLELDPVQNWTDDFEKLAKKAYRRLARETHPDVNNGEDAKFKQVSTAYGVFSDVSEARTYFEAYQTFETLFSNTTEHGE
jgi:hypothetical protein